MLASDLQTCIHCHRELSVLAFKMSDDRTLHDVCKQCYRENRHEEECRKAHDRRDELEEVNTIKAAERRTWSLETGLKRCSTCRQNLPLAEFYIYLNGQYKSECKRCSKARSAAWYKRRGK